MKKTFKRRADKLLNYFDDKLVRVLLALSLGKIVEKTVTLLFPSTDARLVGWVTVSVLISLAYMYEDQLSVENAKDKAEDVKDKAKQ